MSTSITLSLPVVMVGVPTLVAVTGAVTFWALRSYLLDAVDGHRQLAALDDVSARWLWLHGYRSSPHAGPDVTGEVLAVEDAPLAIADQPHHDDEDAPADDTDRPGLRLVLLALVWDLTDRAHDWLADRFKSNARRDAEFRQALDADIDAAPWVLYDEDELRAQGVSEVELRMLRDGYASTPYDDATDAEERWREIESYRATREPQPYTGKHWASDVQHTGAWPTVPAQRDGGERDA